MHTSPCHLCQLVQNHFALEDDSFRTSSHPWKDTPHRNRADDTDMHCASICQSTCRTTFLWTRHMADASNRGVIVVPCDVQPAEIASHSHKVLDSSTGGHATTRNGTDTTSVDRRRTVAADRE